MSSTGSGKDEPVGEERGMISGLERGSVSDGPGIRTVIYLKGCNLRCVWCPTPESQRLESEMSFKGAMCRKCGDCMQAGGAGEAAAGQGFDRDKCADLEAAAKACEVGGLKVVGRTWTVEEVMGELEQDRGRFAATGGGLTLSGGEPLMQAAFAGEICGRDLRAGAGGGVSCMRGDGRFWQ